MSYYLTVPLRIDALVVRNNEISVVNQMADFSILPYFEEVLKEEFYGDTANISESIVSRPFQNKNLRLGQGVHLHWALPDALTHGDEKLQFPCVPDRWLITRRKRTSSGTWAIDQQWIVESNYLYPPHVYKKGVSVNIPYTARTWIYDATKGDKVSGDNKLEHYKYDATNKEAGKVRATQRHRYMGRKMPLSAWRQPDQNAEYYPSLTAIGYGEPTFAAFYPNCFSVFGFHDQQPGDDLTQIKYEVAGWYDNPKLDPVCELVRKQNPTQPAVTDNALCLAIEEKFKWKLAAGQNGAPNRMLCYAGIQFSTNSVTENPESDARATITIANTATEALSARIADILKGTDATKLELIEDQLEAMQLAFRLDEKKLDTVARFRELRHEKSFKPVEGDYLWTIRKETAQSAAMSAGSELPDDIAVLLGQLNKVQKDYDQAWREISTLRKQLFADWYKYMICVYPPEHVLHDYPDPNLVKHFITRKSLDKLQEKLGMTGRIADIERDTSGHVIGVRATNQSRGTSLAYQIIAHTSTLITRIEAFETQLNATRPVEQHVDYYLERVPGPRYWQPNDPVVLIHGDAAKPSHRHGKDGTLTCHLFQAPGTDDALFTTTSSGTRDFAGLAAKINELLALPNSYGLNKWSAQPWNPFILEWQAELFPLRNKGNLEEFVGDYAPDFIADNYQANIQKPDLELKPNKGGIMRVGNPYTGSCILTSRAHGLVKKQLQEHREGLSSDVGTEDFSNPNYTLKKAQEEFDRSGSDFVLAQSLNGFNEALLMHKQTLELQVNDPLGFKAYREFSSTHVREALGDQVVIAPSPLSAFCPIRSGCLKLRQLRLVDTFGQTRDLDTNRIDTTYKMTEPSSKYLVKLPPRISQPARIDFRWLDANGSIAETNAHAATTPICGWILTNRTDQSIAFYDANGKALGYFQSGAWREAIDSDQAIRSVSEIPNAHLRRVAQYIDGNLQNGRFFEDFIGTIDDALLNIHPERSNDLDGTALLIGRPVAVVRARFNLDLCGLPAIDHNWNVFRHDLTTNRRSTHAFTKVQFPVRLGEYGQLNDGLVGYWLETHDNNGTIRFTTEQRDANGNIIHTDDKLFYSPQSDHIDSAAIESHYEDAVDGPINFYQSLDDPAQYLTLLMDPRGSVHATVGVLPNKAIDIPEEHYLEALQNIEVSFLHAPLLTPHGQIHLPLRSAIGHQWSWVEREGNKWRELFPENRIDKQAFIDGYVEATGRSNGEEVWNYLLSPGVRWLATVDDNHDGTMDPDVARVVSKDDRTEDPLRDAQFASFGATIQRVLELRSSGIDPVEFQAVFTGPQELREGWLKLRKTKTSTP